MYLRFALALTALTALPATAQTPGVIDTGEDIYAEDGPWMAIPADFNGGELTATDILAMADLDGDPLTMTEDEKRMIEVLTQVLIAHPAP